MGYRARVSYQGRQGVIVPMGTKALPPIEARQLRLHFSSKVGEIGHVAWLCLNHRSAFKP